MGLAYHVRPLNLIQNTGRTEDTVNHWLEGVGIMEKRNAGIFCLTEYMTASRETGKYLSLQTARN